MSFFEPKPPKEPPAEWPPVPEWLEAPKGWLGGVVGTRVVLATQPDVAVLVHSLYAYPVGVSLAVELRARDERAKPSPQHDLDQVTQAKYTAGELSPGFFRFGIEFADGTKVTNLLSDDDRRALRQGADPPTAPVLTLRVASGSQGNVDLRFWLWPLPAGDHLSFVCEWPACKIPVTYTTMDTAPILDAASRARRFVWSPA